VQPSKPVLLAVDDDAPVLRAVQRDLRKRYAEKYRVVSAESGPAALEALRQLQLRNEPVALLLADQRMPEMSGVEFLERAMSAFPNAKRALLTAYADTEAAIRAINQVRLHHYLLKPWDPPEQNLYPVIDDLLDDWHAEYRPRFDGVRILGTRWSPLTHELKDFFARNHVPYHWLDVEHRDTDEEVRRVADAAGIGNDSELPAVIFPDGSVLFRPDTATLADKLELRTRAGADFYDLMIVGGGPGGLAAAVYGASEGLRTVMIEREAPGGQAGLSSRIENYLGFPSGLSGGDLARRAVAQARRFGVEILAPQEATGLRIDGPYRIIRLRDGVEVSCHALLIATGVQWRKLDVPGMDRLHGAGVYYGAAITEALSCQDETVYVVGGANSAGQAAMHFSRYAREVVMLVRGDSLSATMSQYVIDQIRNTANVRVETRSQVVEVHGEQRLEAISISCGRTGQVERVPATALFIFIGAEPRTDWLAGIVERDTKGFILSGRDLMPSGKLPKDWNQDRDPMLLETSVPGVFVVGDVRHGSVKRVASSVGEGAIAVQMIHQYLSTV
jgi:thioredoxin reductase (NADPH)